MSHVVMYTDGACRGNPGPGGWGVFMSFGSNTKEMFGGDAKTTNNKMELTAAIEGLKALSRSCDVKLYTDSTYVLKGITEWMPNWKKRNWKTAAKKPVQNVELWLELDEAIQRHEIEWCWVKGHSGDPGNDKADELANRGIDECVLA